ncbi:MAG: tryptophan--tRNA ligase [Candidatus Liptonbacteria bacterium]|nr:tryptophan--tRNA ligase [Candidatus Liptonbacteria bacterium]
MAKPSLVSGIQPSGRLHLGNYLGALKNFVELQNSDKYQCYFFIADLHSLTEPFDPKEKSKQILELAADYLAAGLDQKKSTIFLQSAIPSHSELARILENLAPMGELNRMTQFKEKSKTQPGNVNAGLFTYPTLMAADVLLYNAEFVPVGDDQDQHLELTRTLARKFNAKFGKTFIEPQPLHTSAPRVMSLGNPEKKMSKSQPATCLFLDDSPEEIKAKVMRAVTDSGSEVTYDEKRKPAVSNLLMMYASLTGEPTVKIEKKFADKNYSQFKTSLAETIANHFADYRKKKRELTTKSYVLKTILKSGSKKAAKIANKKITEVKEKIGIAI